MSLMVNLIYVFRPGFCSLLSLQNLLRVEYLAKYWGGIKGLKVMLSFLYLAFLL